MYERAGIYCIKGSELPVKKESDNLFPYNGDQYTNKWYFWLDQIDPHYEIPAYCNGNCNALSNEAVIRIWNQE